MSAIRTFCRPSQKVSPSTTQLNRRALPQMDNTAVTLSATGPEAVPNIGSAPARDAQCNAARMIVAATAPFARRLLILLDRCSSRALDPVGGTVFLHGTIFPTRRSFFSGFRSRSDGQDGVRVTSCSPGKGHAEGRGISASRQRRTRSTRAAARRSRSPLRGLRHAVTIQLAGRGRPGSTGRPVATATLAHPAGWRRQSRCSRCVKASASRTAMSPAVASASLSPMRSRLKALLPEPPISGGTCFRRRSFSCPRGGTRSRARSAAADCRP